ncbi:MAG: Cupin 2 conserved barrel domain protein [Edaphobacter sp.]|nr:Cupin 2 conserved barrel domain protein [Edaphobacter sp.]
MRMVSTAALLSCLIANAWSQSANPTATTAPSLTVSHAGARPVVPGSTRFFTGEVKIEQLFPAEEPSRASGGTVTFASGARTNWHTHPYGQVLLITAGTGRVQMDGGPIQGVRAGDVVRIPAHVKHWHGAAPNSSMTHIAIQDYQDGNAVDWLAPVTDQQYSGGK